LSSYALCFKHLFVASNIRMTFDLVAIILQQSK
jgi:hypothetical protein